MPTNRDHLMHLGDHLEVDKGHCSGFLTFTANHLLSLRLITLASEEPIYYQPTTYDHGPCTVIVYQSPASVSRPYCRIADRNMDISNTAGVANVQKMLACNQQNAAQQNDIVADLRGFSRGSPILGR
ncbi:hypothetical protein CCHR01_19497 [Colletotrichum chrysophilum]|uniref:Uncharacterized protein n=1 Tax=Colletotrichum chrysophilum TaxID=1836956 RepID=A0AAD8ZYC7_9PEZI|nr:hypothetical protein CCHR01_19497 [Colletotrichum chrysophilum]